jgi:hypothetical protein
MNRDCAAPQTALAWTRRSETAVRLPALSPEEPYLPPANNGMQQSALCAGADAIG